MQRCFGRFTGQVCMLTVIKRVPVYLTRVPSLIYLSTSRFTTVVFTALLLICLQLHCSVFAFCCVFLRVALTHTYYYLRQRQGYWLEHLFICWFVSRITEKVREGFGLNFQGRLDLAQHKVCKILVVIGIGVRIQDWIFGFFTIAR